MLSAADARPEDRCVHFLALEAEDLGFEVEWLSRTTGAAADDAPYASRTCRLTHAGWDGPVVLDFLAICGLVQISAVYGDKRSRSDVAAAAPRAAVGRRLATRVLRPLQSAEPPHATLAGLPPPLAAQVLACLGARQVRRVAATARGPRVEASRDALWSRLLRRDRAALDVDVPPGDGSLGSGPVVAIYAALALAARARRDVVGRRRREVCRVVGEEEETVARRRDLARALFDFDDADRPYRISPFSPPAPPLEPTFAPTIPRGPTWAPPWAFR